MYGNGRKPWMGFVIEVLRLILAAVSGYFGGAAT